MKNIISLLLSVIIMLGAFTAQTAFAKTGERTTDNHITAQQEAELNKAVNTIVSDLNLKSSSLSALEKTRRIYNFLCSSTTYDYTTLNNSSYNLKYTAYATLVNGTSVCNGYAEAFDILAKKAGLSTAIVMSYNHAWNIVKIGGKYYNIDATWDAYNSNYYAYFLESNADFENCKKSASHKRNSEYKTAAFNKKYPMASKSYYGGNGVKISNCSHKHRKSLYSRKSTCKVSSYGGGKLCKDCGIVTGCGKRGAKLSCKKAWRVIDKATCNFKGEKVYECRYCRKVYKKKTIAKKSHAYVNKVVEEADCCCDGYSAMVCKHCNKEKPKSQKTIKKLGHKVAKVISVDYPATCTFAGSRIIYCSRCKREVYDYPPIDKNAHRWDNGTISVLPGEKTEGRMKYTCSLCGKTKTEAIPATGISGVQFTKSKWNNKTSVRTLEWNLINGYDGFEVYCFNDASFSNGFVKTMKNTESSLEISCLASKKYYYKIRAFKTVNGKKIYTPFSKIRCCYVEDGKGYYKTL
ncbi:MAG: hypothetical protein K6C14_06935 [Eubacterium sp.]|nr:hypothetical protein [Eubacterium sp.]